MEAIATSAFLQSHHSPNSLLLHSHFSTKINFSPFLSKPNLTFSRTIQSKLKLFSSYSVSVDRNHAPFELKSVDEVDEEMNNNDSSKFDWYAQWYPVMPECDLDKRVPHGKKVLGIDVVVWWDKKQNAWKVFDDMCPHRLAPLSEGRIDASGRLQCVYHGWCFDGSGSCKLIPQAPVDGPPVHTNKRACVATYPTVVQYGIVWFWPNSDPQYRDIFERKKPPFIHELSDHSFTTIWGARDFPYGYEVLIENLMDPAHAPYAHYGLLPTQPPKEKRDREGGRPLKFAVNELRVDGYDASVDYGHSVFNAPSVFSIHYYIDATQTEKCMSSTMSLHYFECILLQLARRTAFIFMCIPVSPGNSRLIWSFPRNFDTWIDKVVPRWFNHLGLNMVFDSDLNLLHVEEQRLSEIGGNKNWQKACFVPTKSDALVVGFRRWLTQFGGGEVDWRGNYATDAVLPPTPPREQLMDRYWTHVVNCSSCNSAYKNFKALETILLVLSVGLIAAAAAAKERATMLAPMAMICFTGSRWLAHFVYTYFRYHDYNHAVPPMSLISLIKRVGPPV
ncbi:Protochlorophyllide-dependent translocon component 52, chloroplastic [Linum perenne]